MKCGLCEAESTVVESRIVDGIRWRRRKCACVGGWFTKEVKVEGRWPYVDPRTKGKTAKKRKAPKKPKVTKRVDAPTGKLKVTKDSPEWLKNIAKKLSLPHPEDMETRKKLTQTPPKPLSHVLKRAKASWMK